MLDSNKDQKRALPKGFKLRGSYRIERVLGAGGFAITYLARHIGLDQLVAIKEYLPIDAGLRAKDGVTASAQPGEQEAFAWGLDRFAEEARTLATFDHPNIVSVTDIFECNGTAYMVMEYVDGESLETRLRREGVLGEAELRAILEPILGALEEIHGRGVLHRDIKPENISLDETGRPVLLDFGNSRNPHARKTNGLTVMLTPGFAPAEQYSTKGVQGPWTDIYALGATLYLAIAGFEPPEAPDRAIEDGYQSAREVADGDYSPALLTAIDRALAMKPGRRPQSVEDFRRVLKTSGIRPNTLVPAAWRDAAARRKQAKSRRARLSFRPRGAFAASLLSAVVLGSAYTAWSEVHQAERLQAAEQVRIAAERAERQAAQKAEAARFGQAALRAQAEMARLQALAEARRRAVEAARIRAAENARRREVEAAERRALSQAKRRAMARRQLAQRQAGRDRLSGPGTLLGGVRSLFRNLVPR